MWSKLHADMQRKATVANISPGDQLFMRKNKENHQQNLSLSQIRWRVGKKTVQLLSHHKGLSINKILHMKRHFIQKNRHLIQ